MAEDETSGSGSIRVRNITAQRQFAREVQVERLSVNTDESKSAESDLMREVREVLVEQTTTLEDSLSQIENISQMQLNALRGMSGNSSDMVTQMKEFQRTLKETMREALGGGGGGGSGGSSDEEGLSGAIDKLRQAIVSLGANEAANAAGGDGDTGGSSGGGGVGDAAARAKRFASAADFADLIIGMNDQGERVSRTFGEVADSIKEFTRQGVLQEFRANLINLADTVQRTAAGMVDMGKVTSFWTERFSKSIDIASTGALQFNDAFLDIMPGITRSGDNLADTFDLVKNSISTEMISPIGILGADLAEVSETIRGARLDMINMGVDAASRLTFQESNEAMIALFALERRRSVLADINDVTVRRDMAAQLEYAQLIATNTGMTANEVIKLNQSQAQEFANIQASGILTGQQREGFEQAFASLNNGGMQPIAQLIAGIAAQGGSLDAYLADNPDFAQALAATGNLGVMRAIMDQINSGQTGTTFDANLMNAVRGLNTNNAFTGVAGAANIDQNSRAIFGAAGLARDTTSDNVNPGMVMTGFRYIQDLLANVLPSKEVGMIAALIANTAALGLNTMALGGSGLGGMAKNFGRRARIMANGRGGLIGRAMGGIAGAGAAGRGGLRGLGAGAGAIARGGLGMGLRAIPGLGALYGLGSGAYRMFQGDYKGAALSAGAGLTGLIPGVGTAASLGLSSALIANDMGAFGDPISEAGPATPTASPVTGSSTRNQGLRNDTQRLLLENNRLLERIIVLTEEANGLHEDIKSNTQKVDIRANPGFWASVFGGEEEIASQSQ